MAKTRYNIIEITHKKTGRTYIYEVGCQKFKPFFVSYF